MSFHDSESSDAVTQKLAVDLISRVCQIPVAAQDLVRNHALLPWLQQQCVPDCRDPVPTVQACCDILDSLCGAWADTGHAAPSIDLREELSVVLESLVHVVAQLAAKDPAAIQLGQTVVKVGCVQQEKYAMRLFRFACITSPPLRTL